MGARLAHRPGGPGCARANWPVVAGDIEDIRERLEAIAEELADLAMDQLRQAVSAEGEGPSKVAQMEERRLTRARRAVEKAATTLAGEGSGG
jgi:hypothetical protein